MDIFANALVGFNPLVTGAVTSEGNISTRYKYLMMISSGMLLLSGILYTKFAKAEVGSWDIGTDEQVEKDRRDYMTLD